MHFARYIHKSKCKVKCALVQALRLCTSRTAHRGSRGIALLFLDHGTRRGWGVSVTPRPLFAPEKDLVPIVQKAGWAPGPVWTGAENLNPTGIRSPDRPARSQSLYRLRYPAHAWYIIKIKLQSRIILYWLLICDDDHTKVLRYIRRLKFVLLWRNNHWHVLRVVTSCSYATTDFLLPTDMLEN